MERITSGQSSTFLTKLVKQHLIKEYIETSEYEIRFRILRFIKMFVTTLSFFFFGILTTLGIIVVDGYGFAWNQFFIGSTDLLFITMNYLDNISTALIFITYFWLSPVHVQMIDLTLPLISIISRSFIIALRYGMISDARWEILQKRNQAKWVKSDFIRESWEHLQLSTWIREIKAAKYRLQIEDEDF